MSLTSSLRTKHARAFKSVTKLTAKSATKKLFIGTALALASVTSLATTANAAAIPQSSTSPTARQAAVAEVLPLGGQGGGGVQELAPVAARATSISGTLYPYRFAAYPSNSIDPWGMYKRECVSYVAWKVAASGRHMPYWGGRGNANLWDDNARAAGIPVDTAPRVGDVAIRNSGAYGHAMYVESVNSNGTINVSQYNAHLRGEYSTATVSRAGLVFIHFR